MSGKSSWLHGLMKFFYWKRSGVELLNQFPKIASGCIACQDVWFNSTGNLRLCLRMIVWSYESAQSPFLVGSMISDLLCSACRIYRTEFEIGIYSCLYHWLYLKRNHLFFFSRRRELLGLNRVDVYTRVVRLSIWALCESSLREFTLFLKEWWRLPKFWGGIQVTFRSGAAHHVRTFHFKAVLNKVVWKCWDWFHTNWWHLVKESNFNFLGKIGICHMEEIHLACLWWILCSLIVLSHHEMRDLRTRFSSKTERLSSWRVLLEHDRHSYLSAMIRLYLNELCYLLRKQVSSDLEFKGLCSRWEIFYGMDRE